MAAGHAGARAPPDGQEGGGQESGQGGRARGWARAAPGGRRQEGRRRQEGGAREEGDPSEEGGQEGGQEGGASSPRAGERLTVSTLTIGVDVGGTKVLAGVVDEEGNVLAQARRETPADDTSRTLEFIVEVVEELAHGREIVAVGVGAAGWIDEK